MNEHKRIMKLLKNKYKVTTSKEAAQKFLQELGTHNTDGTLTRLYGGEYTLREDGTRNYEAEQMQPTMGPSDPRPFGGLLE